jgi:hypothetical protein
VDPLGAHSPGITEACTAWNLVTSEVLTSDDAGDTVLLDLGLPAHPALYALGDELEREERTRAPIDRGWVIALLATLLAIHVGRMGGDGTLLGRAWWKEPAWWWTRRFGAWPFSAEWLSAAFDYNTAPFFQSFVEVRVEPLERRLRLRPIGVHGRLRWRDLERSPSVRPAGTTDHDFVEWVIAQ